MNTIWLQEDAPMNKFLRDFPISRTSHSTISLVIGPFEVLNDETINLIIKRLYQNYELNRNNLLLLLHNRLLRLDLSFIRKKKTVLINSSMATFIGNSCYVSKIQFYFFTIIFFSYRSKSIRELKNRLKLKNRIC